MIIPIAVLLIELLESAASLAGAPIAQAIEAPPSTFPAATPATTRNVAPAWNQVNDFVYQLQNIDVKALGKTRFDLAVIDYSADGSQDRRFTRSQIETLKNSTGGAKRVLGYLSIGEAEDYRFYWQNTWKSAPPDWLGKVNPDWPGNYKVKYWDADWQKIVFAYEDKIIDAGFDGVYLDVVDAYEFWRDAGVGDAEQQMVDLVKAIARHAREDKGQKDFAVFVQNASELATHADYLAAITGIGQEDLFYNGNAKQPADETKYVSRYLDKFKAAGKLVLVIDYPTQPAKIEDVYARAHAGGYVPYVARRGLDKLTINKGHEPD